MPSQAACRSHVLRRRMLAAEDLLGDARGFGGVLRIEVRPDLRGIFRREHVTAHQHPYARHFGGQVKAARSENDSSICKICYR